MTSTVAQTEAPDGAAPAGRPAASRWFEAAAVGAGALVVAGAHNDAWAHNHGRVDGTFFTVYHALLYTGVAVAAAFYALAGFRGRRRGLSLRDCLPAGYELSAAGAGLFLVFGGLDLGWHEAFGIEQNSSALFSPTHLGLMISGALIAAGPLRAARARGDRSAGLPAVLSAGMVLSLIWFFLQFNLPFGEVEAARGLVQDGGAQSDLAVKLGADGVLIATATVMGFLLYLLRSFRLRPGTVTLLLAIPAMQDTWIVGPPHPAYLLGAALAGGILGDAVLLLVGAAGLRLRVTAALIPAVFWAVYFAAVRVGYGQVHYEVHVWTGSIVVAGVTGWLLSLLAFPGRAGAAPESEG